MSISISALQSSIEEIYYDVFISGKAIDPDAMLHINNAMDMLNSGTITASYQLDGGWHINEAAKKTILLYFKVKNMEHVEYAGFHYCDKIPLKFMSKNDIINAGVRIVPGAIVRYSAFLGRGCVLMPSFINVGAYIDEGTMIDTWSTVGSCARVGKHCHISGGVGLGGVLEPVNAMPVIIEDNVFIGARSEIAEGVRIGQGAVLSMGVYIGSKTRIYNRNTDSVSYGYVPPYSVVVPGTLPSQDGRTMLYAAIIVKTVDSNTRSSVSINELLRET